MLIQAECVQYNLLQLQVSEGIKKKYFSYFSMKTYGKYSLEVPHLGTSNEYPPYVYMEK